MPIVESPSSIIEEVTTFLASNPGHEQLLEFRPSEAVQQRARELLDLLQNNTLTEEEEKELEQFQNVELLMRLLKAKIRAESES